MAKKKTYSRGGQYIALHELILSSASYRALDCKSRCLLMEFHRICYPLHRNGTLSISTKRAGELLNVKEDTAAKSFYKLVEHGFLILRKEAMWQERMAREWTLTILPCNGSEPTDDWMRWAQGKPVRNVPKRPSKKLPPPIGGQDTPKGGAAGAIQGKTSLYSSEFSALASVENQ